MKCINHHDIDATGTCIKCGCGVCAECKLELAGRTYCQVCADVYSQLQPEAVLAACVNVLNIDGVTVCYKCGQKISNDRKQVFHDKTFCQHCAHEIIMQEANVTLFLAEMDKRNTSDNHVPRRKRPMFSPYKLMLPFLPVDPLVIIGGEMLHGLSRVTRRYSNVDCEKRADRYQDKSIYLKHLNNVAGVCLIAGLFLTFIIPLCLIFPLVATPGGQNTLDTMVKAGITLAVIGAILTMLSLYLHLAVRIGIRIATLLLGIVLIIFGIVWIVKF